MAIGEQTGKNGDQLLQSVVVQDGLNQEVNSETGGDRFQREM